MEINHLAIEPRTLYDSNVIQNGYLPDLVPFRAILGKISAAAL